MKIEKAIINYCPLAPRFYITASISDNTVRDSQTASVVKTFNCVNYEELAENLANELNAEYSSVVQNS